jgi:hypothetical protein
VIWQRVEQGTRRFKEDWEKVVDLLDKEGREGVLEGYRV